MCNILFFTVTLMLVYYADELTSESTSLKHEDFDLSAGIITDKALVKSDVKYQVGILKPGVTSSTSEAVAGGKACDPLPKVVYRPV